MKFNIINYLKEIISPKKCYSCNIEWHFLCKECLEKIGLYKEYCYICKNNNFIFRIHEECKKDIYFDKILVLTKYKNKIIKKLLKNSKYYSKKDILEDFWFYLWELLERNEYIKNNEDYLIIPVPMFFSRKFSRWYNHSEILAKYIWEEIWIKTSNKIVKRIKNTRQQSKLSKKERELNLKDSFKISRKLKDIIDKKNIILVDDIISTWTTINEISKILKENWVKSITWLVVASN